MVKTMHADTAERVKVADDDVDFGRNPAHCGDDEFFDLALVAVLFEAGQALERHFHSSQIAFLQIAPHGSDRSARIVKDRACPGLLTRHCHH